MRIIYKYVLDSTTTLTVPVGSTVLSVQAQQEQVTLWMSEPYIREEMEERTFLSVVTGFQTFADNLLYVGTVQLSHGQYVMHVFEVPK